MPESNISDLRDVFIYAMIDDYLKSCKHVVLTGQSATGEPPKLSDSEILFIYITACLDFGGNMSKSMTAHHRNRKIKGSLDKSQFNRRLYALYDRIWEVFMLLAMFAKETNSAYSLDSFPVAVCKNIRIGRSRIVKGEAYRGYNASKREYFYGFKIHAVVAQDGRIVEFDFSPGRDYDTVAFLLLPFDLPQNTEVFADKAYNDYTEEDLLAENANIRLMPVRKKNSKKNDNNYVTNYLKQICRRHIETDFSVLQNLFPKKIHAVTQAGFILKLIGFVIAHNLNFYF